MNVSHIRRFLLVAAVLFALQQLIAPFADRRAKADESATPKPIQDFLRSLFNSGAPLGNKALSDEPEVVHRKDFPDRNLSVSFSDSGGEIVIGRDKRQKRLSLPAGLFWDEPIFTPKGRFVFLIANKGTQFGGYSPDSIYRIQLPSRSDDLSKVKSERIMSVKGLTHKDFKDPVITQIYAAAESGKRLLVQVGYKDTFKSKGSTTYTGYQPFFLKVRSKTLELVVP